MLVLTRRKDQWISIGDNIKVRILRTNSASVRIGIDAPESFKILRGELTEDKGDTENIEIELPIS